MYHFIFRYNRRLVDVFDNNFKSHCHEQCVSERKFNIYTYWVNLRIDIRKTLYWVELLCKIPTAFYRMHNQFTKHYLKYYNLL